MIKTITKLAIVSMVFIQCSSSATNTTKRSKYDPYLIFIEEISASNFDNAYDLISFARPVWLRGSVFNSINFKKTSYPYVYVNGTRYGHMLSLKSIYIVNIYKIEFIRAIDATTRFGADHTGGAIFIKIIY